MLHFLPFPLCVGEWVGGRMRWWVRTYACVYVLASTICVFCIFRLPLIIPLFFFVSEIWFCTSCCFLLYYFLVALFITLKMIYC